MPFVARAIWLSNGLVRPSSLAGVVGDLFDGAESEAMDMLPTVLGGPGDTRPGSFLRSHLTLVYLVPASVRV